MWLKLLTRYRNGGGSENVNNRGVRAAVIMVVEMIVVVEVAAITLVLRDFLIKNLMLNI